MIPLGQPLLHLTRLTADTKGCERKSAVRRLCPPASHVTRLSALFIHLLTRSAAKREAFGRKERVMRWGDDKQRVTEAGPSCRRLITSSGFRFLRSSSPPSSPEARAVRNGVREGPADRRGDPVETDQGRNQPFS